MKIILLTTFTPHHLYFYKKLRNKLNIKFVIFEKKKKVSTQDVVEKNFYKFEIKKLFNNNFYNFLKKDEYLFVKNINSKKSSEKFKKYDLAISYGISKLAKSNLFKKNFIINLHGGDQNFYRGLDSHLWAIYHKDFKNMYDSVHWVSNKLDTGNLIAKKNFYLKITYYPYRRKKNFSLNSQLHKSSQHYSNTLSC